LASRGLLVYTIHIRPLRCHKHPESFSIFSNTKVAFFIEYLSYAFQDYGGQDLL
jgi:hypothetical protein